MTSILNQQLASDTDDEDFVLEDAPAILSEEESGESGLEDSTSSGKRKKKRSKIEVNQKDIQETLKKETDEEKTKRINDIWESMKKTSTSRKREYSLTDYLKNKADKKNQTFKFAGETYTTTSTDLLDIKLKPKQKLQTNKIQDSQSPNSQSIDQNLDTLPSDTSLKTKKSSSTARKMKKSRLEALAIKYGVSESIRLNTLEKSKLDWNKFVEEEGIKDELKRKNKDGYLERIAFLQRVDDRQEEQIQAMKKKSIQNT